MLIFIIKKNFLCLEMLMLTHMLDIDIFVGMGKKNIFKSDFKKKLIFLEIDIFGYMGKKRLFQRDLKISSLS